MMLDEALAYRHRGLSVIPIKSKDKKALIQWESYQKEAASESTIKHWFESWPNANLAIVTGAVSDCVVIDLDSVDAKNKLQSMLADSDLSGVPRSRTGKGWQLFFKHPGVNIPNRAAVIPGLDVRGDGGYVVAPPSIHPNGKTYQWEVPLNGHLPTIPAELLKLISTTTANSDGGYRDKFDTAGALAGVPEGQRDATVFKLACKLRSADVPQEMAEQLILEAAKNCDPPFSEKIALEKVRRAYQKYEPNENGTAKSQTSFWPEPLSMKQFLSRPIDATRWIWDKTFASRGTSLLVSPPRHGKTRLALNAGLAICRGVPFLGRETYRAPVLYLSLDNSNEDMDELVTKLGVTSEDPLFIHAGAIPQNADAWLFDVIKRNGIKLAIVDTLQRFFHLEDSNAYAEAVNRMEPIDNVAKDAGFHVMYLHHSGKNNSFLGTTAFKAMCATYMELSRVGELQQRILSSDQRNGRNFESVAIGIDKHGWLQVIGTYEDAQINEVVPKIREFVEMDEEGVTEPNIRKNMPARGIIVSKAIRVMYRGGTLERIGQGKKGDPFKYHLSSSLILIPNKRGESLGLAGLESEKQQKTVVNTTKNSSPEFWDKNGTSTDKNPKSETPGLESVGFEFFDEV